MMAFDNLAGSELLFALAVSALLVFVLVVSTRWAERRSRLRSQAELERVYSVAPIGMFSLSLEGRLTNANPILREMLDIPELNAHYGLWENHFGRQAWIRLVNALETDGQAELEIHNLRQAPHIPRRSYLVKAVLENDRIEGSLQDITGHADAISKLRLQANRDPLTDALNLKGIDLQLADSLRLLEEGKALVLGYLELNSLKTLNNLYGKSAGDDVLKQICERARQALGVDGQLGRLTGSEFLIFFVNVGLEKARQLCQSVLDDLHANPCLVGTTPFRFNASMGLVGIEPAQIDDHDAVLVAKRAAREARGSGLNHVVVHHHSAEALSAQSQELRLLRKFSSGLDVTGFSVVMQPIMSLYDPFGSLNFEVLLRMHDAKGVLVPTGTVISAAEESGIMPLIDHWVMSTTLQWLHNNHHRLNNTKFVCVNLNGMSLNDDSFVEMFFALFDRYGHVGRKLLIEITESVAVKDMERTRAFILRVQDKGAKVALDDFGAGYTSFAYLKQLPANALKIDGSFICNMNEHPTDIAIVRAIVALAKSLDMVCIAEWVEDLATLRTLKELGLDYVQGYVIARPQQPELIPYALNSAGFIEDKRTRQYLSYGQPKAHAL